MVPGGAAQTAVHANMTKVMFEDRRHVWSRRDEKWHKANFSQIRPGYNARDFILGAPLKKPPRCGGFFNGLGERRKPLFTQI